MYTHHDRYGVLLKDENKHADMFDILQHLQKSYVPTVHGQVEVECYSTGESIKADLIDHHKILLGGDLLTSVRVRGVQRLMQNSDDLVLKCDGLKAVSEDWHAKVTLLEVNNHLIVNMYYNFI